VTTIGSITRPRASLLLRDVLLSLVAVAGLWLVHAYGRVMPVGLVVAVWLSLAALIALGLFWRNRIRRQALLGAYLATGSGLFRWLRGGWLMAIRHFVVGAVLAAALGVALVRVTEPATWSVLVLGAPLMVIARGAVDWLLRTHVNARYLSELSWRVAIVAVGLALFGALVALGLHREYPHFGQASLEQAVWHMVDRELARSAAFEMLLQMAAAKDALRLWLAQQLVPGVGTALLRLMAWSIVLAEEVLFVWSYLLFCNGVVVGAGVAGGYGRSG
jgi:hypothetical protein